MLSSPCKACCATYSKAPPSSPRLDPLPALELSSTASLFSSSLVKGVKSRRLPLSFLPHAPFLSHLFHRQPTLPTTMGELQLGDSGAPHRCSEQVGRVVSSSKELTRCLCALVPSLYITTLSSDPTRPLCLPTYRLNPPLHLAHSSIARARHHAQDSSRTTLTRPRLTLLFTEESSTSRAGLTR